MSSGLAGGPRRVVLTGGPGAGKTAVLELARRDLCPHVEVLPESASILFGGGFPRDGSDAVKKGAQRAIYHVQVELERIAAWRADAIVALCDRGTLDALAYWPGPWDDFFHDLGTSMPAELARYAAVIHLRVPEDAGSYRKNAIRRESHREALEIDASLLEVWSHHPRRVVIEANGDFLVKARSALRAIGDELGEHRCAAGYREAG